MLQAHIGVVIDSSAMNDWCDRVQLEGDLGQIV